MNLEMPEMTTTMRESAARHMAAGVMDLDELARLVELDVGKAPGPATLADYRSRFRRNGDGWIEVERARINSMTNRWGTENPGRNSERSRRWEADNAAKNLLNKCRSNAKSRALDFELTVKHIEDMLAPMTCSVTGLPLAWGHAGNSKANPWRPSIDRIDCAIGYRPGNIRIVCWAFNQMRGDFPDEVVFALAKAVAARAP